MNYTDPLFNLIVFVVIILIGVLIGLGIEKFKEYLREKNLKNLIKEFDYLNEKEDSLNNLLTLARAYSISGDYEKALKIYMFLERKTKSIFFLKEIARVYLKAGFLEKSKHILYSILKSHPRDKEALKLLITVDEKLKDFKELEEIINIFEELGDELEKEKANLLIKKGFFEKAYKQYPFTKREYVEFLFKTNPKKAYQLVDVYEHLDLYFYRDDIPDNEKFCNILSAKKLKKCNIKAKFEIEVLKHLPKDLAKLEFEYICKNCKKIFPIYSTRCPNCNELFCFKLIMKISKI